MIHKRPLVLFLFFQTILCVLIISAQAGPKTIDDGYGEYVFVPAGEFEMGDNFEEGDADEVPVHTVYLDAYYIGKYKVTNKEYQKLIKDKGYENPDYWAVGGFNEYGEEPRFWKDPRFKGGGIPGNENYPVVGISWFEAVAYCCWLSAKTGVSYRLPTEAEWEKAARGTDQRRFAWGNEIDRHYANYEHSGDPFEPGITPVDYYDGTTRNGFETKKNVSASGACEMIGNVWEWCLDWYGGSAYYAVSEKNNPCGPDSGSSRILRAGGWVDSSYYHRAANRNSSFPENRNPIQGFRCVREVANLNND